MNKPDVVAFDVIETLFSLEALRPRIKEIGLPANSLQLWFAKLVRDGATLAATSSYKSFDEVARSTLTEVLQDESLQVNNDIVEEILLTFSELAPHPDVLEALQFLTKSRVRIIALTNCGAATVERLFTSHELDSYIEKVISIEEVRLWKPAREVYAYAASSVRVDPGKVALIAAHPWDTHGANCAGLRSGWVNRTNKSYPSTMDKPDVIGSSLVQVCRMIIAE